MRKLLGIAVLSLGIVLAGNWVAIQAQTGDCYVRLPGCLDPSFGTNGKVSSPPGMYINAATLQEVAGEARLVTVGMVGTSWAITRYLPDGTVEKTFGSENSGQAKAVAVQRLNSQNYLLVGGYMPTSVEYRNRSFVRNQLYIFRYKEEGLLDTSFGDNGKVRVSDPDYPASPTEARSIAIQPSDEKIVVSVSYNGTPGVVRLTAAGQMDSSYNNDGQYVCDYYPSCISAGNALAVQTIDGTDRVVFAGEDRPKWNFLAFRLKPSGILDKDFGVQGLASTNLGNASVQESYEGVVIDSENRIVAVGNAGPVSAWMWNPRMAIARYTPAGVLDTSFAGVGVLGPSSRLKEDLARTVAIQPDGRIVVAGRITSYDNHNTGGNSYMSTWRFNSDGSSDLSFGNNGWVSTELPNWTNASAASALIQPDGKIIVAGNVSRPTNNPFVARYYGYLPPTVANDIAIYSIVASPALVTQGEDVTVQVTVGNNGTDTQNATVVLTETPGGKTFEQAVQHPLASGEVLPLNFVWTTSTSTTNNAHALMATLKSGDNRPENDARSTSVNVAPPVTIILSARGYRVATSPTVDLTWNVTSAASMDIYRNDFQTNRVTNTGKFTDNPGPDKSKGTFIYKVCESGSTTRCSSKVTVVF